jgi:carbonic anhydrase
MTSLAQILEENRNWAQQQVKNDPDYFERLSNLQAPQYLWIGCADSRVPANVITGLQPGEVFVHRNVANLVHPSDMNCMAVLQFAIEQLNVRHIIVCGHYGCGGVHAALDAPSNGVIDYWLEPIRHLAREHKDELTGLTEVDDRENRLCELNIREQVRNLSNSLVIRNAWKADKKLEIHGWVYSLKDGLLHDLECSYSGLSDR